MINVGGNGGWKVIGESVLVLYPVQQGNEYY